jgi:peptidoglycan/LPS O-acetylase OafA/YrhL
MAAVVLPLSGGRFAQATLTGALGDFLLHTLRLTEFSHTGAFARNLYPGIVNGSTWSISYEFWCYVGVAGLLAAGLLKRRWWMLTIFTVAWLTGIAFRIEGWVLGGKALGAIVGPPQMWARMLPLYLAGVVFYLFRERIPLNGRLAGVCAALLLGGCGLQFGWALLFPWAGAYLLFWFAFTPAVRPHRFGRYGDFSYGTYLYAFPIEQLLMQQFGQAVAPAVLFACAAPLTLMAAVASWYGVERHFLAAVRRKETIVQAVAEEVAG